jgi:hypothetical protein
MFVDISLEALLPYFEKLNASSKELNLSNFDYTVIQVNNPEGLDIYTFLDGWVEGVKFIKIDKIDDVEL